MHLYRSTRFLISAWYANAPLRSASIGVSFCLLMAAMAMCAAAHVELQRLASQMANVSRQIPRAVPAVNNHDVTQVLPAFASAPLVSAFNTVAGDMHLAFDEMSYSLESQEAMPFKRYRITLTAGAGYPELRKFIPAITQAFPNIDLDSIRCTRADLAAATLVCELAFSAYYSKSVDA